MKSMEEIVKWTLPEYRERHVFVVRLRLAIFLGFWVFYLSFFWNVLEQVASITALVTTCFLLTGLAYYNVLKDRWLASSFVLELISDLTAITSVLYLTGGPHSTYFTVYIFYIFFVGALYNYMLAAFCSGFALLWYGGFLWMCNQGIIPPLLLDYGDQVPLPSYTPLAHFLFSTVFLAVTVYALKIASHFSRKREEQLEARNKEFAALHSMSSTIRSTYSLSEVIDQVIGGVMEGLNFSGVLMLRFEKTSQESVARIYTLQDHVKTKRLEEILGVSLHQVKLPAAWEDSSLLQTVLSRRIAFRKDINEALAGMDMFISQDKIEQLQHEFDVHRVIAVPLVAGDNVLGALIGFSKTNFVSAQFVERLEGFANQAALTIEAAQLIDQLRHANQRLEEANRVKSEFLATMSHELRTPLTAIIGFSELLIEGVMGEMTQEQKETLQEVLNNGEDLLQLINSLLDLAKIESGKMPLEMQLFAVPALVKRVSRMVDSLVQQKSLQVRLQLAEQVSVIKGDERKVQQVLLNLLSNAIKFTPNGGVIEIIAKHFGSWQEIADEMQKQSGPNLLDMQEGFAQGAVHLKVKDTGIGIAPEQLTTIFEPFRQADSSMTRTYGGTGLGLALAKQFVELHDGLIWAESEQGAGACFNVILPNREGAKT